MVAGGQGRESLLPGLGLQAGGDDGDLGDQVHVVMDQPPAVRFTAVHVGGPGGKALAALPTSNHGRLLVGRTAAA